jgi:hypothetical protein
MGNFLFGILAGCFVLAVAYLVAGIGHDLTVRRLRQERDQWQNRAMDCQRRWENRR